MALRPGHRHLLPPFAPQILQPFHIVRDGRGARLDPPVASVNMLIRKRFLQGSGIGEPEPDVLVERGLVALHRHGAVPALLHDPRRRVALGVQGVDGHDPARQLQDVQQGRHRPELVRLAVDLDLPEHDPGAGRERLDQMKRRALRGVRERAPERLAVNRNLVVRKRRQQLLREQRQRRSKLLRIKGVEQVGEGVVARRAALERHETAQKLEFGAREPRERVARRPAGQRRQQGDRQHLDQVVRRGVAPPGIGNPLENIAEPFHLLPPETALGRCFDRRVAPSGGKGKRKISRAKALLYLSGCLIAR